MLSKESFYIYGLSQSVNIELYTGVIMSLFKICHKCNIEKSFSEFSKRSAAKDGLQYSCKLCVTAYSEFNKDKLTTYRKDYYKDNKDRIALYLSTNKDKISTLCAAYSRKHYQDNKDRYIAKSAKRRAKKLNATPYWLTKEHFEEIEELYLCARMFKLYTGEEYHVDHIVPLQGKNVCGLHVPWNLQVIPAKENLSKSNKI